jgi:hypothetical protein
LIIAKHGSCMHRASTARLWAELPLLCGQYHTQQPHCLLSTSASAKISSTLSQAPATYFCFIYWRTTIILMYWVKSSRFALPSLTWFVLRETQFFRVLVRDCNLNANSEYQLILGGALYMVNDGLD